MRADPALWSVVHGGEDEKGDMKGWERIRGGKMTGRGSVIFLEEKRNRLIVGVVTAETGGAPPFFLIFAAASSEVQFWIFSTQK